MRLLLIFVVCLLLGAEASARVQELREAASPNRRYAVKAVEKGNPVQISYEIVSRRSGAVLLRLPSSYQPEEGEGDWSWEHTIQAEVSWSTDSRYVAIDEQVHRYIGDVLVAEVGEVNRSIRIPEESLVARTGRSWSRYRVRLREGWLPNGRLALGLAGKVVASTDENQISTYKHIQFRFLLRFKHGKAAIAQLDPPEDF